jgi:2-dehydro-3-deoxyphosphogluconate aldolase / (4S)-4-hydroxy-2-oxoglutarate aldolase
MAQYSRLDVYNTMLQTGLVPLFFSGDLEVAQKVAEACLEGGARLLEFTNRGEGALKVFAGLQEHLQKNKIPLVLGVGSVMDAPTAALFIAHGANYIVSPVLLPEVAKLCNRRKIAYMPGCGSVTEISQAEELGAEIVKIFPGESVGGPGFVKAVLGPMPWSRLMPTGGVDATQESIGAWIKAGACCVGMGSNLIRKEFLSKKDYSGISGTVKQVLEMVVAARS